MERRPLVERVSSNTAENCSSDSFAMTRAATKVEKSQAKMTLAQLVPPMNALTRGELCEL